MANPDRGASTTLFLSTPSARRATELGYAAMSALLEFLSTPSARRATSQNHNNTWSKSISIHALREEGDQRRTAYPVLRRYFYPRPPRGGRLADVVKQRVDFLISIHALREEGDSTSISVAFAFFHFYPRPPRGGRPKSWHEAAAATVFLSTPSARRST